MRRMVKRRIVLAAAFGLVLPVRVQAADAPLEQPLRDLYVALETVMRSGRATPFLQRFEIVAPAVDRAFDLQTVLRVSIGMRWDSMPEATQTQLFKAYRRFTIATYVANFDKYDGERFLIVPAIRDSGSDRIVATEIITGAEHLRLDYVMRRDGGIWRAVDVLLEGSISRVAVQRSDFRKILGGDGPEALISSLRRKITDLSDGALNS